MARTHNQIFQEWRATNPTERFRDYWQRRWEEQIKLYLSFGWQLIPVRHREKQPAKGANWKTDRFSYDVLRWHVLQGGNLAVNAGESNVTIIDLDSKRLPPALSMGIFKLPTMETPKGYAFVTRGPVIGELFDKLKSDYPDFDSPRGEGKYELVPFSETCAVPKHDTKDATCPPHDFRIREWVYGLSAYQIPSFTEFATVCLLRGRA